MTPIYRYAIRNPRRVIAAAVLITLAVAPGALRLRLRTDGNALLPTDAGEVRLDRSIRDTFGVRDKIAVVLRSDGPRGVFNRHALELVREWTRRFGEIEGVGPEHVVSLATEKSDRFYPGTLRNRRLLDPPLETPEDLERIRDDVRRIRLYTGTLVSYDETAAAILIGVPTGIDRTRLYGVLRDVIAERGPIPEQVCVVGAPVAESLLGAHILEDLGVPAFLTGTRAPRGKVAGGRSFPASFYELRLFIGRHIGLVPIAVVIMALVFLLHFRSVAATVLPLVEVGACLIFVFGLMGTCGVPVYLTIAVLPIILTAMGIADEIHIFSRYRHRLRSGQRSAISRQPSAISRQPSAISRQPSAISDQPSAFSPVANVVGSTMDEMWRPVVKTSLTTAIALLSFALSPIAPVRAFGIFTAVGILFCMFWSLTVIPACLVLVRPCRFVRNAAFTDNSMPSDRASFFRRLASAVVRRRRVAILAGVAVLIAAPFGVQRVLVQDSWIDGFAPGSDFYKATQSINRLFHGTHMLLVCVDTGHRRATGQATLNHDHPFQAALSLDEAVAPRRLIGQWLRIRAQDAPTDRTDPTVRGPVPAAAPPRRFDQFVRVESVVRREGQLVVTTSAKDGPLTPPLEARRTGPRGRGAQIGGTGVSPLLDRDASFPCEISPRRLLSPEVIRMIAGLEAFIDTHREDAVGGVVGPADYLSTTNYMTGKQKESRRRIPDDAGRILWLWRQYDMVRGPQRLREILDEDHARGLITVFMEDANYISTRHLMRDIRDYERQYLTPRGISLTFAGDVAVSQTLIRAIVTTQVRSLLLSLLGILAMTTLMGRSLGWGATCVLPCGMAVLVNFAVMGVLGMPLGVATSMFSAMTLGIGVDYAIHLTERFRTGGTVVSPVLPPGGTVVSPVLPPGGTGVSPVSLPGGTGVSPVLRPTAQDRVVDAVCATGPAVVLDALAVALGFGVMVLSQVPSNARLGALVVLSVGTCLLATLFVLPALLAVWQPAALRTPRAR